MENELKQPEPPIEDEIKNILDCKFLYANQIFNQLMSKFRVISNPGLNKALDRMVNKKEIAYLDNNKINYDHLILLGLSPVDSVQRFYLQTPLSSDFYKKLVNHVNNIGKEEKFKQRISDIVDIFRALEVSAHLQNAFITNDNIIKKDLKESKKLKRITQEVIETKKANAQIDIQNFFHKEINVRLLIDHIKIKKGDKEFLLINNYHVPLEDLVKFMRSMKFNQTMYWFVFGHQKNIDDYVFPLVDMMKELFVDILKESQIKV